MTRSIAAVALGVTLVLSSAGCGGDEAAGARACPDGASARETINELDGTGMETRDEAVRAELSALGLRATDDAVTAGVIAAAPAGDAGGELVTIETDSGAATMTLSPMNPGWAVEATSYCDPGGAGSG